MKHVFTTLFIIAATLAAKAQSSANLLDINFGQNGKVLLHSTSMYNGFSDICIQPDNKILLCGLTDSSGKVRTYITRLNANGSVDNSFGQNGTVIDKVWYEAYGGKMTLQPDGKILIMGTVDSPFPSQKEDMFVMRLLPNGTRDATFGNNGVFMTQISDGYSKYDYGDVFKLAADGSIFVGGFFSAQQGFLANSNMVVYKITSGGQFDLSFGTGGYQTIPNNHNYCFLEDMELLSNGKMLFTGGIGMHPPVDTTFCLRLNANGSIDNSFATNGVFIKSFPSGDQWGTDIVSTFHNKILVCGYEESGGSADIFIYRLSINGVIDTTFGTQGFASYDSGAQDSPRSMSQLPNGNLMVNGVRSSTSQPGWNDIAVVAFDSTGVVKTNFASSGAFVYDVNNSSDVSYCSALQPDGKLICAGFSDTNFMAIRIYSTEDFTGLKQAALRKSSITVFPNPASDHVIIQSPAAIAGYELIDASGRLARSASKLNNNTLETAQLPEGLYYLKLMMPNNAFEVQKLEIRH